MFSADLLSAGSTGDGFFGAIGIGKVTSSAFSIGVTAVPMPIDEVFWDGWLYHQFFSIHSSLSNARTGISIDIDSKAMRKLQGEETIYAAIQVIEIGVATMNVHLDTRMLFILS